MSSRNFLGKEDCIVSYNGIVELNMTSSLHIVKCLSPSKTEFERVKCVALLCIGAHVCGLKKDTHSNFERGHQVLAIE